MGSRRQNVQITESDNGWKVSSDAGEQEYPTGVEALRAVKENAARMGVLITIIDWNARSIFGRAVVMALQEVNRG